MSGRLRRQLVDALPETAHRRIQRLRNGESPRLSGPAGHHRFRHTEPEVVDAFDADAVRSETTRAIVTVRQKYRHGVHPPLREVLVELEKRHPDEFARVAASRFRHPDDLSIPSSLHHTYAYLRGRAVTGTMQYRYQIPEVEPLMRGFLDEYFPLPSQDERP